MAKSKNQNCVPEWVSQISELRRQLKMNQGQLARRIECSTMTVSRWERGLQAPTADFYIKLGRLAGKDKCWFFWKRAGFRMADFAHVLPREKNVKPIFAPASAAVARFAAIPQQKIVALPVLRAVAATHGNRGDKIRNLDMIPATKLVATPSDWCPNPRYTGLLRVRGSSMKPLIRDGDTLAVDSLQTDKFELDGKVVVATHEEKGLCVSRFRRYGDVELLESENHEHQSVVLGKNSGWRILGKVLWWISAAP